MDTPLHNSCDPLKLSAFHDGELPADQAVAVEAHVAHCPTCASELAQLRAMSRRLATLGQGPLPAAVFTRLRNPTSYRTQRLIYRSAWALSASSVAAMLLCALVLWRAGAAPAPATPQPTGMGAASLIVAVAGESGSPAAEPTETQLAAAWMLEGLARKE
jgi:anti-sigma factor RsiW